MSLSLFQLFFPTPTYLKMSSVGLDISDKSVRFLGFDVHGNKIKIGRYTEKSLPSGVVVSGKINDHNKMKESLSAIKKEYNLDFVRVSLPEEQAYLFRMKIPHIKKDEIRESITFQFEEYVPVKAVDSIFDYEILSESPDGFDVQVSVIPKAVVESYNNTFVESGLIPISFEIEAQAIARAVVPNSFKGTCMIIDFGQTRTGISIVSSNVVVFTSTIDIGGYLLTETIAKEFAVDIKEAEKMKRESGLAQEKEEKKKKGERDVFSVMLNTIATLRDEVNKHFIYWHTHKEGGIAEHPPIEKLILCGGDSNLKGLPDYLSRSMRVNVELADVWANIPEFKKHVPEISFKDSLTYATAIGLALADLKK